MLVFSCAVQLYKAPLASLTFYNMYCYGLLNVAIGKIILFSHSNFTELPVQLLTIMFSNIVSNFNVHTGR